MPFFRHKRRFHHQRDDQQELTYFRKQELPVPDNTTGNGGGGGIVAATVVTVPQGPNGTGVLGADAQLIYAEAPISQYIGQYKFDFSRWLYQTFARPLQTSGTIDTNQWQFSLVSYFRKLRFNTATMAFQRVDYGGTQQALTNTGSPGSVPSTVLSSPVPQRVKLWWLRIGTHDPSFDPTLLTPFSFRGHPRARYAYLKPRQTLKFRFHPVAFLPPRYLATMARTLAVQDGGIPEHVQYRRQELRSHAVRLGWIDTSLVTPTALFARNEPTNKVGYGGVNPQQCRVLSPTIFFMFEEDQIGTATFVSGNLNGQVLTPISGVLIRRSESCSVCFRGLIPFTSSTFISGGQVFQGPGIGSIETTTPYNSPTPGSSPPATTSLEVFDPPHLASIVPDSGQAPLWRTAAPGQDLNNFSSVAVPLDQEIQMAPYNTAGATGQGPSLPAPAGDLP